MKRKKPSDRTRARRLSAENSELHEHLIGMKKSYDLTVKGLRDRISALRDTGWIERAAKYYIELVESDRQAPYNTNAREALVNIFCAARDEGLL